MDEKAFDVVERGQYYSYHPIVVECDWENRLMLNTWHMMSNDNQWHGWKGVGSGQNMTNLLLYTLTCGIWYGKNRYQEQISRVYDQKLTKLRYRRRHASTL